LHYDQRKSLQTTRRQSGGLESDKPSNVQFIFDYDEPRGNHSTVPSH
jgi:hypothetical protein